MKVKDRWNKTILEKIGPRDEEGSGGQGVGLQSPRGSRGQPKRSKGDKG